MPPSRPSAEDPRPRPRRRRRRPAWRRSPSPGLAERLADDRANASLEFLGAGTLLLVPVVYLVVALAALQSGSFAVTGAARQAARVYASAPDDARGRAALEDAIAVTLADYGVTGDPEVSVTCAPDPSDCLARGGRITVAITVRIPLPLAPVALGGGAPAIPVSATAVQPVSRFRTDALAGTGGP